MTAGCPDTSRPSPRRDVAAAYSVTGCVWQDGPGAVYDRLAEVVVGASPVPLDGCRALDIGAGTGAATRALLSAGARGVVAVDVAFGMLAHGAGGWSAGVLGDAVALPFVTGCFDVAVAAFSLNHLTDPAVGLREAARVTRAGGGLVVSAYAADDDHPVKHAVEAALAARGWSPEPWYRVVREEAAPKLATVDAARAAARAAGLHAGTDIEVRRVPFPDLGAADLVAWRLGLAQHAPFVAQLPTADERAAVAYDAAARLGDSFPPLERSIVILGAVRR